MSEQEEQIRKREERAVLFGMYGLAGTWLIAAALLTFKVLTGRLAGEGIPGAQIILSVVALSSTYLAITFAVRAPLWTGRLHVFIIAVLAFWLFGLFWITSELNYLHPEAQDTIPCVIYAVCLVIRLMKDAIVKQAKRVAATTAETEAGKAGEVK